jgi:hypothetical protein
MLPPPGTKLEKQKPGNLEYRQNQGENRGREADRRRNKHLKMNLFPSARALAQKKLN